MENEIKQKIKLKIRELIKAALDENTEMPISDDNDEHDLDSIVFIRFIVMIETEFDIEIPDEFLLMNQMNSIEKIATVIEGLTKNINS